MTPLLHLLLLSLLIPALPNTSAAEDGAAFYNTLDYGLVHATAQGLVTKCSTADKTQYKRPERDARSERDARPERDAVLCTEGAEFCVLTNTVLHNTVLSTPCTVPPSPAHSPTNSWMRELERAVVRERVECRHYTHQEDAVLLFKPDLLDNIYHHVDTLLNTYISYLVTQQLSHSPDVTIVAYGMGATRDVTRHKHRDLWERVFGRSVKSLQDIRYTEGVCIKRLYLALPTRRTNSLLYTAPPSLPLLASSGSRLVRDFSSLLRGGAVTRDSVTRSILFVTRDTPHRRLLNEQEVLETLQQHFSVQVVEMSEHNITTQIRLASQHHVLVGVHGAALTHLLFLSPPAVLLELFDCGERSYRNLAALSGVRYYTIPRTQVQVLYDKQTRANNVTPKEANIRIAPAVVLGKVQAVFDDVFGRQSRTEL